MAPQHFLSINLPVTSYQEISLQNQVPPELCHKIRSFIKGKGYSRVLLFGSGHTGQVVSNCIEEYFAGFIDTRSLNQAHQGKAEAILITTAPLHVRQVQETLSKSPLAELPTISLFAEEGKNIRMILESQPRSGTDYLIENIRRTLDLDYASVYPFPNGMRRDDEHVFYGPKSGRGYIIKTHFMRPLHYPQYRYVPHLFLISFFPDTYYKWARMIAPESDRPNYRLTPVRPEWQIISSYIPLHLRWLRYIAKLDVLRFEDFYLDFQGTIESLASLLGERPEGFIPPRTPSRRLYWREDFSKRMDPAMTHELLVRFREPICFFYPEKSHLLP